MVTKGLQLKEFSLHSRLISGGSVTAAAAFPVIVPWRRWRAALCIVCSLFALTALGAERPKSSSQAEVADKRSNPANMKSFQIPSHGALPNAFAYVAAGTGPHPIVVLLHGFPGNERNLDLAQDIRHAGWDVLYFDYRGSWGSPGDFSFSHGIEDTAAAIAYLRTSTMAKILRLDPSRIVVIGHSLGGFMAVQVAAGDPAILGMGLISAADIGGRIPQPLSHVREQATLQRLIAEYQREGMAPLAGCTPEGLALEAIGNAAQWSFMTKVDSLADRPVLVITANDAYTHEEQAFAAALRRAGNGRVATVHLAADHVYSDQRSALSDAVLRWLATLPPPGQQSTY